MRGQWGWVNNFIANFLLSKVVERGDSIAGPGYAALKPHISQLQHCPEFKCDGTQEKVLRFLHGIEQDLEKCHLLNGWEWGPIWGSGSGHRAVVVYPEGTDWKKEGTVLDPWPTQEPEWYRIAEWEKKFPGIAGETVEGYRDKYPTTMNWREDLEKKAWYWKAWDWLEEEDKNDVTESSLGWIRLPEYMAAQFKRWITGLAECPVDLVITDQEGRRSGVLEDGSMAFEVPHCFVVNAPDEEGDAHWYFELDPETAGPCRLEIRGKGEGTFQLLVANAPSGSMLYYDEQPISPGAVAELVLDVGDPEAPLVLSDGREIRPIVIEPALQELASSELTVRVEDASGEPGRTAEVTIYAAGALDVGRLHVELLYDEAILTPEQVSQGTLAADSMLVTDPDSPGRVSIGLIDRRGFSGDGPVAVVTFDVRGEAGDISELDLKGVEAGLADEASTAIDVATESGTFRVVGAAVGDEGGPSRKILYALCAAPLAAVLLLVALVAWGRRAPGRRLNP
jgi:hypothetical protein